MYQLANGSSTVYNVTACSDDLSQLHVKDLASSYKQLIGKCLSLYSEDGVLACTVDLKNIEILMDIGSQDGIIIINR